MSFFTKPEPYKREVEFEGEKGEITLRRLNAGDQAAIQDTLRMSISEDSDASLAIGTMRMLTVQRALLDWDWHPKPTPETIAQLEPDVFEQIYSFCEIGTPPTERASANGSQDGTAEAQASEETEAETQVIPPKKTPQKSAAAS